MSIVVPDELAGGATERAVVIDGGLQKLSTKYLTPWRGYRDWKSFDFDLYATRCRRLPGWADRIEGPDLWATLLMNSRLREKEARALMAASEAIQKALVPVVDAQIADADLSARYAELTALFRAVRVPGVAIAKATKLLCMKRPNLIPMLDSVVVGALCGGHRWSGRADPGGFAVDVLYAMERFQALLLHDDNRAACDSIRDELNRRLAARAARLGFETAPEVTSARVLESLVWWEFEGHRHYPTLYEHDLD